MDQITMSFVIWSIYTQGIDVNFANSLAFYQLYDTSYLFVRNTLPGQRLTPSQRIAGNLAERSVHRTLLPACRHTALLVRWVPPRHGGC